ncbi:hypothetical protein IJJ97_03615 [bacterium]|nr:hypothetical protein [bacterium]
MNNQRRENFEFFEYDDKKFKIGKFTALTGTYLIANYFPKIAPLIPMIFNSLNGDFSTMGIPNFSPFKDKKEYEKFLIDVLSTVQIERKAGYFPIIDESGSFDVELEENTFLVLILSYKSLQFNAKDFFLEKNQNILQKEMKDFSFFTQQM